MTAAERDAIGSINIDLEKAEIMADEISTEFFRYDDPKKKGQEILWDYPRYQTFNFILFDYLYLAKKALNELIDQFDNQRKEGATQ